MGAEPQRLTLAWCFWGSFRHNYLVLVASPGQGDPQVGPVQPQSRFNNLQHLAFFSFLLSATLRLVSVCVLSSRLASPRVPPCFEQIEQKDPPFNIIPASLTWPLFTYLPTYPYRSRRIPFPRQTGHLASILGTGKNAWIDNLASWVNHDGWHIRQPARATPNSSVILPLRL